MIEEIRKMIVEMNSMHNDGYVRDHYYKKLLEIKEVVEKGLKGYKP